jgi:hypothetical protein
MSLEERNQEIKKAFCKFVVSLCMLGALFLFVIIMYIRGTGILTIQYIEKANVIQMYHKELIKSRNRIETLERINHQMDSIHRRNRKI